MTLLVIQFSYFLLFDFCVFEKVQDVQPKIQLVQGENQEPIFAKLRRLSLINLNDWSQKFCQPMIRKVNLEFLFSNTSLFGFGLGDAFHRKESGIPRGILLHTQTGITNCESR